MALAELGMAALFAGDQAGAVRLAQQAEQAAAGIPGWMARLCSIILTDALLAAGDLAAAEDVCAAGLARSRQAGDLQSQAALLTQTADLDLHAGRVEDAAVHLREALQVTARTGSGMELLNDLDYCGHLCAQTRRYAEALTLWAAYAALLRYEGYADPPPYARRRPGPLREAQQALGHARVRVAEERGAAMSLATAAEYALLLTALDPAVVAPDARNLSARERELVTLVAQGRTNAQIAAQLYISVHTVSSHLDRIRDKTSCRRRADLTRLALSTGLV